jgi:hypothetical protein
MVTEDDIRSLYANWNGNEAANELSDTVLEATAAYVNKCELEIYGDYAERAAVSTALSVFLMIEDGEFKSFGVEFKNGSEHGVMKVFDGESNEVVFTSDKEDDIRNVLITTMNFYAEDEHGNTLQGDGDWQIAGKDFT